MRLFLAVGKVSVRVNIVVSVSVVSVTIMKMSLGAMSSPVGVAAKRLLHKRWSLIFVAIFRLGHCLLSWISKWFVNKVLKILANHTGLGINVWHHALLIFICYFWRCLLSATVVVFILQRGVKISVFFRFRHLSLLKTIYNRTLARSSEFLINRNTRRLRATSIDSTVLCVPAVPTCCPARVRRHHLWMTASSVLRVVIIWILELLLVTTISLHLFRVPIFWHLFVPMTVSVAVTVSHFITVLFLSWRRPPSLIVLVLVLSVSLVFGTLIPLSPRAYLL